jgi:hypothetical protein
MVSIEGEDNLDTASMRLELLELEGLGFSQAGRVKELKPETGVSLVYMILKLANSHVLS